MAQLTTTFEIAVDKEAVYQYLRNRYDGQLYRSACANAIGYTPAIRCIEDVPNAKIAFSVPSRMRLAAWQWGYNLDRVGQDKTKVTIWYRWSVFSNLATAGTSKKQAANEIAQTALALQALAFKPTQPQDAR